MATIWIPGIARLPVSRPGGGIVSKAAPRVVWHTVEATPGSASAWTGAIRTLNEKSAEPHILYDPVDDRIGQFLALNTSARALRNDGGTLTNRVGRACIQIEVVARSAVPFTTYWRPGPNFAALMAAIHSWTIPDIWPAGAPPVFIANPPHNVPESPRSRDIWLTHGGHYGHSQIPGNDHGDPGAISPRALFAAANQPPKDVFTVGQFEEIIAEQKRQGDATRQEVRRQAIWVTRYAAQTEDERAQADNAFDQVITDGGTVADALAAAQRVMNPLVQDLKKMADENG